jgi:transcriptional regulator with GAF, ATPase, and Fis domain
VVIPSRAAACLATIQCVSALAAADHPAAERRGTTRVRYWALRRISQLMRTSRIERALILWPARVIEPTAFPERIAAQPSSAPQLGGNCTAESIEREHILRVIARSATLEDAARVLGIDSSTLWRKRKRYEDGEKA